MKKRSCIRIPSTILGVLFASILAGSLADGHAAKHQPDAGRAAGEEPAAALI